MRVTAGAVRFALLAWAVGAAACAPAPGFYDSCIDPADCPDGWSCPEGDPLTHGAVGFVCTPACVVDQDCVDGVGRSDVGCEVGLCVTLCGDDADCPVSQPECRGSDPSCAGSGLRPYCAQRRGFTCP